MLVCTDILSSLRIWPAARWVPMSEMVTAIWVEVLLERRGTSQEMVFECV